MMGQSTEIKHDTAVCQSNVYRIWYLINNNKKYFLPKISTDIHRTVVNPVVLPPQNTGYKPVEERSGNNPPPYDQQ
jgi:hypothetical protein